MKSRNLQDSEPSVEERLRGVPLFAVLEAGARHSLVPRLSPRRLKRGQTVFLQGDPGQEMYLLVEGRVRIACESLNGREITLAVLSEGGFFGEMALLDGEARSATAVAEDPCSLLVLHRSDFQDFLLQSPEAGIAMLGFLSQRLRRANEKIQDFALLTAGQRLAALLCDLAFKEGEADPKGGGVLLGKSINHTSLAALLGSSRETVSRLCSELKDRGLLESKGRRLRVVHLEGLQELVAESAVR